MDKHPIGDLMSVTMEKIRIKASKNVKFRPSKSLKDKVN